MKRKVLAALLVIGGLGLIVYPILRDYYYEFQQEKIVAEWQDSLQQISEGSTDEKNGINQPESKNDQSQSMQEATRVSSPDLTQEMEALLLIDKIDLKVPVLTGVNERNLNLAVASIENTGKPGEVGNYCISGHRSRTYGLLFNRLNELDKGDRVVIETKDKNYVYLVTARFIIQPEEVQVLKSDGQKKQITLVTCDYSRKPYLRLIVQGELQS